MFEGANTNSILKRTSNVPRLSCKHRLALVALQRSQEIYQGTQAANSIYAKVAHDGQKSMTKSFQHVIIGQMIVSASTCLQCFDFDHCPRDFRR